MDRVPLSVSRWESVPRMNANLKYLLDGEKDVRAPVPEEVVRASFEIFRNHVEQIDFRPQDDCWSVYFARRNQYLREASAAQAGARDGDLLRRVGDIAVDQPPKRRRRVIRRDQ
jgi:hypothetical protein